MLYISCQNGLWILFHNWISSASGGSDGSIILDLEGIMAFKLDILSLPLTYAVFLVKAYHNLSTVVRVKYCIRFFYMVSYLVFQFGL